MPVVRSTYRQILRLGNKACSRYRDPNDIYFALFGIMLQREDFAAAGYGSDFTGILHSSFARPSVADDRRDAPAARLAAGFAVLRKLNDLMHNPNHFTVRSASARCVTEASEDKDVAASSTASGPEIQDPSLLPNKAVSHVREEGEHDEGDDEDVIVGAGTVFVARSQQRKVQKFYRHVVVCKQNEQFPPYPYLLPPEPMYPINLRVEFPLPIPVDALIALASRCRLSVLQVQKDPVGKDTAPQSGMRPPSPISDRNSVESGVSGGEALTKGEGAFPTTSQELHRLLDDIPTRSVAQTDFMEVEVYTQFVCSNTRATRSNITSTATDGVTSPTGPGTAVDDGSPLSTSSSSSALFKGDDGDLNLFLYYVFIRNRGPARNPKLWHVQLVSQHVVVVGMDGNVVEMVRPGVSGNFPLLGPGESHTFEAGTSLRGTEGVLRGTFQLNAFNEEGEIRTMDAVFGPTRLSTTVSSAHCSRTPLTEKTPCRRQRDECIVRCNDDDEPLAATPKASELSEERKDE